MGSSAVTAATVFVAARRRGDHGLIFVVVHPTSALVLSSSSIKAAACQTNATTATSAVELFDADRLYLDPNHSAQEQLTEGGVCLRESLSPIGQTNLSQPEFLDALRLIVTSLPSHAAQDARTTHNAWLYPLVPASPAWTTAGDDAWLFCEQVYRRALSASGKAPVEAPPDTEDAHAQDAQYGQHAAYPVDESRYLEAPLEDPFRIQAPHASSEFAANDGEKVGGKQRQPPESYANGTSAPPACSSAFGNSRQEPSGYPQETAKQRSLDSPEAVSQHRHPRPGPSRDNTSDLRSENEVPPAQVGEANLELRYDGRLNLRFHEEESPVTSPSADPFLGTCTPHYDESPPAYQSHSIRTDLLQDRRLVPAILSSDVKPLPDVDAKVPHLCIVIHIVGSRGDVAPFMPIAEKLAAHGHRVRVATHAKFKQWVAKRAAIIQGQGCIEFFDLGGDPERLMAFMVKNGGLIPSVSSMAAGDIKANRHELDELLNGAFSSCREPHPDTGLPFIADAIIANPPSFGSIHCAELFQIPLHVMFTMPWTKTGAFAHPFTTVGHVHGEQQVKRNRLTYDTVQRLTWIGYSDLIEKKRKDLGFPQADLSKINKALNSELIPHTYCYSPSLLPKPKDWGPQIEVVGFSFENPKLDNADYQPSDELKRFMAEDPPPIYVGFGSIIGFDMKKLYSIILQAASRKGLRMIVCQGWSDLQLPNSPNVMVIPECPHDWLFPRCAAVIHHGGAGTTSMGLRYGLPTVILSFFGDQGFWGQVVHNAGAGPASVPAKTVTLHFMESALDTILSEETRQNAIRLRDNIRREDGAEAAVQSFFRHLPSSIAPSDLGSMLKAQWIHRPTGIKISGLEAVALVENGKIEQSDLEDLHEKRLDITDDIQGDSNFVGAAAEGIFAGLTGTLRHPIEGYKNGHFVRGVGKGLGGIVVEPSKGAARVLNDLSTALSRAQRLYDPTFKPHKHVTDFKSGAKEGIKSFSLNWLGAITDTVVKPVELGRKEGARGAAKGLVIGCVNVPVKITAASLDLLVLPTRGAVKSIKKHKKEKHKEREKHKRAHSALFKDGAGESPRSSSDVRSLENATDRQLHISGHGGHADRDLSRSTSPSLSSDPHVDGQDDHAAWDEQEVISWNVEEILWAWNHAIAVKYGRA
ncbi:hypothetical protein ACQY0O_007785 [Thecaphora frezii]